MKYFKRLKVWKNATGRVTLDLATMKGWSYDWYQIVACIDNRVFVNSCRYSMATGGHVSSCEETLNAHNISFEYLYAPQGLQNLSGAVEYQKYEIKKLIAAILKKSSRPKVNNRRRLEIASHNEEITLLRKLNRASHKYNLSKIEKPLILKPKGLEEDLCIFKDGRIKVGCQQLAAGSMQSIIKAFKLHSKQKAA